jgi:acylphosphatase
MERVEIIASGDVQRVGFRDLVEKLGRDLGLSGTVENQEPYDVRIVAEGEEEPLKEFLRALRIKRGPIQVRDLEVSWASATGEFPYFKILRGDWQEELGERFDVAVRLLTRSVELGEENLAVGKENLAVGKENLAVGKENLAVGKENLAVGKENLAVGKENLAVGKENLAVGKENLAVGKENLAIGKKMLDKQDATISILKNIKDDTSEIGAIKEEVSTARYEARSEREEIISTLKNGSMEEKYEELRREIAEIKASIAEIRAKVS